MNCAARLLCSLVIGSTVHPAWAQNLVQNGSFEDYYDCPIGAGAVAQAVHWTSPFNGSADYFHACSTVPTNAVPWSYLGNQVPADGQGYMGMCTYKEQNPVYRELILTELSEPLLIGVPVCLSFRLAVGGYGAFGPNSPRHTAAGVGMKFFVQTPTDWEGYFYPSTWPLKMENTPTDTAQWYWVHDVFIPDSAYTQLVIGNLSPDSLNNVLVLDSSGYGQWPYAYAFVDDVRVSYDLQFCSSGVGIAESVTTEAEVFPNPFAAYLHVNVATHGSGRVSIELHDALGSLVRSWDAQRGSNVLAIPDLPAGPYLLTIQDAGCSRRTVRVFHF